jgi:uncharacterized protein (TIGR02246 family)
MPRLRRIAASRISFDRGGHGAADRRTSLATDEQQIRDLMAEWSRRTADGDIEGVLALMTDDAVFLTRGNAPMTKADFTAGFRGFAGKVEIEATQDIKDLQVSEDLAYAWSHLSVAMTNAETGSRTERVGHVLTVFRKSPAGKWLLARDANLMAAGKTGA